ncbi:hypothetical protein J6590_015668 [Homalodisca vitripennis]|nr:hypothetical protein J6590_015668 [Homalodisca vitripennis]
MKTGQFFISDNDHIVMATDRAKNRAHTESPKRHVNVGFRQSGHNHSSTDDVTYTA